MKITMEHLGNKAVIEDDTAHDVCDAIEIFEKALMKIGFEGLRINGAFLWKAGEIAKKDEEE